MSKNGGPPIIKYLSSHEDWKQGYKVFHKFLAKPLGWFFHLEPHIFLRRINRKECCNLFTEVAHNKTTCPRFIRDFTHQMLNEGTGSRAPRFFKCYKGKLCAFVPLPKYEKTGGIVFCSLNQKDAQVDEKLHCFVPFMRFAMELYEKTVDLENVYETVHPRALALSSLHSINRVISSTMKLDDLIPRIGRLCAQILKASYCSIVLVDETRKWMMPRFVLDPTGNEQNRKRFAMGKGVIGHVAETGEFHIGRACLSLPLIDDDVIGVLTVKDKIGRLPFNRSDIEVLKALSEQAVVAIRNSQLLEEHERITLGSIKSINNILDINLPHERMYTRVFADVVCELAQRVGVDEEELQNIQRAASILDAGHLGVPDYIRNKKGKLTKREYSIIKTHPYHGVEIIKSIDSLKPVIPIILYHHERYDGKGYPEGLRENEIPLGARIVSIVVAFMAMITERPYRPARSFDEALAEIEQGAGTQFDPHIVEHFLSLVHEERIQHMLRGI